MDPRRHPIASFAPRRLERATVTGEIATLAHEVGVVLFADVSGFTKLADDLEGGAGGVDAVQQTLSDGFSRLIDAVDGHGGDIIGFSGDAMTAWWPRSADAVTRAAAAALEGIAALDEAGIGFQMRMGIGEGEVHRWRLGGFGDRWLATTSGPAVHAAAIAQESANAGDVVAAQGIDLDEHVIVEPDAEGQVSRITGLGDDVPLRETVAGIDLDDDQLEHLRQYLPVSVDDRIKAGQGHFLSEIRVITSLFLLLPQFGEDGADATNELIADVQAVVAKYEGSFNKISVDEKGAALLIAFGLPPLAHEDDIDRALMTAVEIDDILTKSSQLHGIGLAHGRAFCGTIGNDVRQEYTVIGDVVNMSARLAAAGVESEAGNVYCDDATVAETAGIWEFTTPLSLRLKGKLELLTARQPVERTGRTTTEYTAMVGRKADLQWILAQVQSGGNGSVKSVAMICGEAGIGKSQLLGAVSTHAPELEMVPAFGFADPVSSALAYHPWAHVFRDLVGSVGSADELTDSLDPDLRDRAPLLDFAMRFEIPGTDATADMSDEARIGATRSLLVELLRRSAEKQPRMVLLEDAHWFDSGSWALIEQAAAIPELALVISSRPLENVPEVQNLSESGRLSIRQLEPLDLEQSAELLAEALGAADISDELIAAVHARCEGNPFFVIEVAASLHRSGSIEIVGGTAGFHEGKEPSEDLLPHNIQAALTSRIDQLSTSEQLTIKVASVIGPIFRTETLLAVHPTKPTEAELAADLDSLAANDLLVDDASSTGEFAFKHALIREAAYQLLLSDQRQQLHRTVAEHLESTVTDFAPLHQELGLHWAQAGVNDKAAGYYQQASVEALSDGLPKEAVDLGVRAAHLLDVKLETDPERIGESIPTELAEIARLMAGRSPLDLAHLPAIEDEQAAAGIGTVLQTMPAAFMNLQSELFALMSIRNLDLTLRYGASMFASGVYSMYSIVSRALTGDHATAYDFSELARIIDERNGGILAPSVAFVHGWFNNHWRNHIETSIPTAEEGAELGLAGQDLLYGCFNLAATAVYAAAAGHPIAGVIDRSVAATDRIADRVASAAFHARLEAQVAKALAGSTDSLVDLGDDWCSEEQLAEIMATTSYNQMAYYLTAKLKLLTMAGSAHAGLEFGNQAEALRPSFAGQPGEFDFVVWMALAEISDDDPAADRAALIESARTRLDQIDQWRQLCPANFEHKWALVAAELAAQDGEDDAAEPLFDQAISAADEHGFVNYAGLAAERKGRWMAGLQRSDEASRAFATAAEHYENWGADRLAAAVRELQEQIT